MNEEEKDRMATWFVAIFFLSFGFLMQVIAWWFIFTGGPQFFQLFSMVMIYGGIWMIYFGTIIPTSSPESRPEYRKRSRFPTAPRASRIPTQQAYARIGARYDSSMRGGRPQIPRAGRRQPDEDYRVY